MTNAYMTSSGIIIAKQGQENKAIEYFGSEEKFKNSINNNIFKVTLDEDGEQVGEW